MAVQFAEVAEVGVGARLRALREAMGLSQRELAEKSGVDHTHIGAIEVGMIKEPRRSTLDRLAKALDVSGLDLISPEAKRTWKADFLSDPAYSAEFKKTIVQLMDQEERRLLERRRRK